MTIESFKQRLLQSGAVEIDPLRACGKPVVIGTRFPVAQLIAQVAEGDTPQMISEHFDMPIHDVVAAINAVAWALDESYAESAR